MRRHSILIIKLLYHFLQSLVILVGVAFSLSGQAKAETLYSVTDLGTLPGNTFSLAYGINDIGQVVGQSGAQAFLWDANTGMTGLGTLPGNNFSIAYGINDSGLVVGASEGGGRPKPTYGTPTLA